MEIGWFGVLLLLIAWACTGVATGLSFYLYTKDKNYDMNLNDKGYLLSAGVTSAVAVAFTTVVALMIFFMGRNEYKRHIKEKHDLMNEKLELENRLNDLQKNSGSQREEDNKVSVLDNPIPLRRGRNGRPLIS